MNIVSRSAARLALALAATMLMGLALAPGAFGASQLTENFGTLSFQAAPGVDNNVTVVANPGKVTIFDSADTITEASAKCTGSGTNTVECLGGAEDFFGVNFGLEEFGPDANDDSLTASGSLRISANGGGDEDELISTGTGRFEASGGGDDDMIVGGSGEDSLSGEEGNDTVTGNAGNDALQGGEGNGDVVNGNAGSDLFIVSFPDGTNDQLNGEAGLDVLLMLVFGETPPAFNVDLGAGVASTGGESDKLGSIEDVVTFQGSDTVTGSAGSNRIITALDEEPVLAGVGGIGSEIAVDAGDTVNPAGGPDFVSTGTGNDIVNTVDGSADRLDCGPDTDVVQADQLDELLECENVTVTNVTPVGATPPDTRAPVCTLKGIAAGYKRSAFLRGLRASVSCDESVKLEAQLTTRASAKGQRKGKRGPFASISRAGDLILAEGLGSGTAATLSLRPSVPRSLLPRSFSATLRVVARDQAGNTTVLTRSIRVKPDRKKGKKAAKG